MLTFETLFAVLQGLPFFYLDYLDREWLGLCKKIYRALQAGCDPVTALRYAIQESSPHQVRALRDTFQKAQPIMELPGLSFRQKETLVALRLAKVASLAALNRTLMQDPAHVHRRLAALVRKGYAVKFVRPDGVFYYAAEKPLEHSAKAAAYKMIMELMQTLLNDPELTTLASFVRRKHPLYRQYRQCRQHRQCRLYRQCRQLASGPLQQPASLFEAQRLWRRIGSMPAASRRAAAT